MGKEGWGERRGGEGTGGGYAPSSDSGACSLAAGSQHCHLVREPLLVFRVSHGLAFACPTQPERAGRFQTRVWQGAGEGTFPRHKG